MGNDERAMLAVTTRQLLETTPAAGVTAALRELGWFELRGDDRRAAEQTLFELQGETLTGSSVFDLVLAEDAGIGADDRVAVVHPLPGGAGPPGAFTGDGFEVEGLITHPGPVDRLLVPTASAAVLLALAATDRLRCTTIEGMDPWVGWHRVSGTVAAEGLARMPAGTGPDRTGSSFTGTAVGHRLLAHELVGVTRTVLALAVDHARERHQFGRPIGSFQALQTRLADVKVALEVAEQATVAAWDAGPSGAADGPVGWGPPEETTAALAKILAGHAARLAARHGQQALGGMGFTWEHPLHRYVRRVLALDALHGSAAQLTLELGAVVGRTGRAPGLVHI